MCFLHRLWIWCKRFRHRCGYGVHSPADFFLITSVIYEQGPYYAYRPLARTPFDDSLPHYRRKVNRLLFRLVNYLRPATLLEVGTGNGEAFAYMQAARRTMEAETREGTDHDRTLRELEAYLSLHPSLDCLHIGHTPFYREVFERALPCVGRQTCFIVGGIHDSKEKCAWWKQIVDSDERTGVTFDLYDVGLIFFDKARYKQHHIVNFL